MPEKPKSKFELVKVEYDRDTGTWNGAFRIRHVKGLNDVVITAHVPASNPGRMPGEEGLILPVEQATLQLREAIHRVLQELLSAATDDLRKADQPRRGDDVASR